MTPPVEQTAPRARVGLALIAMLTFGMTLLCAAALFALAIDRSAGAFVYIAILALVVTIGTVVCTVISAALGTAAPAEPTLRDYYALAHGSPAEPSPGPSLQ